MSWFDSHCHLKGFWEKGILEEILDRAAGQGVDKMTVIGTSPDDWKTNRAICAENPSALCFSAGLHPSYVGPGWEEQLRGLAEIWLKSPKPVAVGEIGLDYFRLPKDQSEAEQIKRMQRNAFRDQLAFARDLDLPVVVHSRSAFADCLELIDKSGVDWTKVVFHCFAEGPGEIRQLMDRGGVASFTGILTFKKNHLLREAALLQGAEKLMLETDSPYLSPEPVRGRTNEPAHLRHIGDFASELFDLSAECLAEQTFERTREVYSV